MYTGKRTSIKRIFESINTNEDIAAIGITEADIVEWVGHALDLLGVKLIYEQAPPERIDIEHYQGELPCDWIKVIQVRDWETKQPFVYKTDNFHRKDCYFDENSPNEVLNAKNTYELNGNYIYTNMEEGELEFNYIRIATDEEGFPMIPEDTKPFLAVLAYVNYKIDWKLLRRRKIDPYIYQESKSEWSFRAGQAKVFSLTPKNTDQWESLKNQLVRLIPNTTAHSLGMKHLNNREIIPNVSNK